MKKIRIVFSALFMVLTLPVFADEPKFIRDSSNGYIYGCRLYDTSEYLNGNYRTNFVNIPQSRMLNYMDGFQWKVGVFELDGNTLYLGWSADGKGNLLLCDENKNFFITADSYLKQEESFFRYGNGNWGGIVKEIELKGKKYTVAVAGLSSSKLGIFSDSDGFRMWVENEPAKDTAFSKKNGNTINYVSADIREGVYKPGWKRLWGTYAYTDEMNNIIFKYNYKGTDFIVDYNQNAAESILNMDRSQISLKNLSEGFHVYQTDKTGKDTDGVGIGFEADAQLGKNKVRLAVISCNGKWVFVKDTSGYPVVQTKKAAPAKKAEKAKKPGKTAAFTRDYTKLKRVYSKEDISKGIYKPNYKSISQSGTRGLIVRRTNKDGEQTDVEINFGNFELDNYILSIGCEDSSTWHVIPSDEEGKAVNISYYKDRDFLIKDCPSSGAELEVTLNGKLYNIAVVLLDAETIDYRLFVKAAPDELTALCEKDVFGIEYYDFVDLQAGVYKPGFECLSGRRVSDEALKALFEGSGRTDIVYSYTYNGTKFLIGPTQDPANYVKNLDGSVIYNPEIQIRYRLEDKNGNALSKQGYSYGWEGKVRLGDKNVILAVFKWDYNVSVFVKEAK